jgi:hypothetical protein
MKLLSNQSANDSHQSGLRFGEDQQQMDQILNPEQPVGGFICADFVVQKFALLAPRGHTENCLRESALAVHSAKFW